VKIYVSSDMEGTAGVVDWDQVRDHGPRYEHFAELLLGEVNAAIEGAQKAGATEFLVNDAHGRMANLLPDRLTGSARYLSGRLKPDYMMEGLDGSFDAAFFVSYHGSMQADSTLSHTYYPAAFAQVTINGVVAGESGVNALAALGHGVPVVLVTGDDVTAAETDAFCPGIHAAVVKTSVSRFAANALHPTAARALIAERACLATTTLHAARPIAISLPATLRVACKTTDYAALAARVGGWERTGPLEVSTVGDDPLELYRRFITVVLLCRGLIE